jgi:hypothetical protein
MCADISITSPMGLPPLSLVKVARPASSTADDQCCQASQFRRGDRQVLASLQVVVP